MTDRINALTVVLDRDIREDDVQPIIDAISMVRHVQQVTPHVAELESHIAYSRARADLQHRLWEALKDDKAP